MKALVLENIGKLIYKDVPKPVLKSGEVLLKIHACGICSSDVPRIFKTGTYSFPTIPGHEISGEVIDVAQDVESSYIGKKAVVFPLLPCRKCSSCEIGEYARCEDYSYFGSRCDGAFAEYLAVPLWNLVPFSDAIPFETAALCEPAAVAKHCADAGNIAVGDTVAVIGTGTIGLLAAIWAKINGAAHVVMVGRSTEKLLFARQVGIEEGINVLEQNAINKFRTSLNQKGADVVLECVGSEAAICNAIELCRKGGRVVLTGNPDGDVSIPKAIYWKILRGELTLTGTWNSRFNHEKNDWKTVLDFMENGRLPVASLVTHKYPLSQYDKALQTMLDKTILSIKVMFVM